MTMTPIKEDHDPDCLLTIAVCTYQRFNWLRKCLDSLEKQSLDKSLYKILVVDNSQQKESYEIRDSLGNRESVEYIITEKSGLSYARNVALEKCDTPYLAFIDDDALADPDWADSIIRTFKECSCSVGVVGGLVEPIWEEEPPPWIKGRLLQSLSVIDWGSDSKIVDGTKEWLVAANVAYRTDALRKTGGFPENLGRNKDLLLCHEELYVHNILKDAGYFLVYSPDVRVQHLVEKERTTVEWLLRDAFWERISREIVEKKLDSSVFSKKKVVSAIEKTIKKLILAENVKEDTDTIVLALARFSEEGKRFVERILLESGTKLPIPKTLIPSVFIVTPSFNAADTIDRTIQSVIFQQGEFFLHYHVQDGGSEDDTVEKLKEWKERLDSGQVHSLSRRICFSWISKPDEGIYDAIIRGFDLMAIPADGIMAWINADDYLHNGAIANVVKLFSQHKDAQWSGGTTDVHDSSGAKLGCYPAIFPQKIVSEGLCDRDHWQMIQQEGTFWRKSLWDKVGGLSRELKFAGDWDLWRRFAQHAQICLFPWPQGSFQQREGQLSSQWDLYKGEMDSIVSEANREQALLRISQDPFSLNHISVLAEAVSRTFTLDRKFLRPEAIPNPARKFFMEMAPQYFNALKVNTPADKVVPASEVKQGNEVTVENKWTVAINYLESALKRLIRLPWFIRCWIVIQHSRLFFPSYYLQRNPDVAAGRVNPLKHYILHGTAEGRNPNPLFNTKWYVSRCPDVAKRGMNPLFHYIKYGWKEGRNPGPEFSTDDYLKAHQDIRGKGINPLKHYFQHGIAEGRRSFPCQK